MSRPKNNTDKLYVWLSPAISKKLVEACSAVGVSKSEFIRSLLFREFGLTATDRGAKNDSGREESL